MNTTTLHNTTMIITFIINLLGSPLGLQGFGWDSRWYLLALGNLGDPLALAAAASLHPVSVAEKYLVTVGDCERL